MAKLQLCRLVTKREGSRTGWSQAGSAEHLKGQDPWSNGLGLRHHPTGPLPSPVHKLSHPALFQGMAEAQHPSSPGFIVLQNPALSPLAGCWGAGWSPAGRGPGWPQFSWQDSLSGVLWAPLPPAAAQQTALPRGTTFGSGPTASTNGLPPALPPTVKGRATEEGARRQ